MFERTATSNEPLRAVVYRGGIFEAAHAACLAAVDESGRSIVSAGEDIVTTLRSAAKPLQAVPLVTHPSFDTLGLRDEELAICCASHPGEPRHAALAASVLALSGFSPDDLVCGPGGDTPANVRHGCSGNHAAILLLAHLLGAPLAGYHVPYHPAQQVILESLGKLSCSDDIAIATDGCGIPTFGIRLSEMARAFASLGQPRAPWAPIPNAMAAYPELIGSEDWIDVRLIRATRGRLIAKTGAEGLICIGDRSRGAGIAIKVLDGSTRPLGLFTLVALHHAGWISEEELASPELAPFISPVYLSSTGEPAATLQLQQ